MSISSLLFLQFHQKWIIQSHAQAAFIINVISVIVGIVHIDIKGYRHQVQFQPCLVLSLFAGHKKPCIGIQRTQHIGFPFDESKHSGIPVVVVPVAGAYVEMADFVLGIYVRFIAPVVPVPVFRAYGHLGNRLHFDMGAVNAVGSTVVPIPRFRIHNAAKGAGHACACQCQNGGHT